MLAATERQAVGRMQYRTLPNANAGTANSGLRAICYSPWFLHLERTVTGIASRLSHPSGLLTLCVSCSSVGSGTILNQSGYALVHRCIGGTVRKAHCYAGGIEKLFGMRTAMLAQLEGSFGSAHLRSRDWEAVDVHFKWAVAYRRCTSESDPNQRSMAARRAERAR